MSSRRLIDMGGGTPRPPKLELITERFYPAGTYTWHVPAAVNSVDVFLVGGGAGGRSAGGYYKAGSGGGYTKTFRGTGYTRPSSGTWSGSYYNGRDGNAVSVTPGTAITIIVGSGGAANQAGSYSQFMNSNYVAEGGEVGGRGDLGGNFYGGNGGSGGGSCQCDGGIDGDDGYYWHNDTSGSRGNCGKGQGHTTRDFGESSGKPNAGGSYGDDAGSSRYCRNKQGYSEGMGSDNPGSGYGGAGWSYDGNSGGGDGTVLIRYYAYK